MLLFNANNGYLEAMLRGYRSGLITKAQYLNFTQCEVLDDLKVQLSSTDYAEYFSSVPSPLKTNILAEQLRASFVDQFRYLKKNASEELSRFLDYISYEYMIDNVILIIRGSLREQSREELISRCHPLGFFDSMPALMVAQTIADLYNTVLVETPLAPYFRECFSADDLDELNVEIIRMTLYRAYLEDFNNFIKTELDQTTALTMGKLLSFEADRRIISITINSLSTDLSREDRLRLFPRFGQLWDSGIAERLVRADDPLQIKSILEVSCPEYRGFFDTIQEDNRSLDEKFFEREIELCKDAFDYQFCFTPFYAFVKLREQEIRNVIWIGECICQKQKDSIHHYIPIF